MRLLLCLLPETPALAPLPAAHVAQGRGDARDKLPVLSFRIHTLAKCSGSSRSRIPRSHDLSYAPEMFPFSCGNSVEMEPTFQFT